MLVDDFVAALETHFGDSSVLGFNLDRLTSEEHVTPCSVGSMQAAATGKFYFFVTAFHAPAITKAVKSPSIAHNAAIEPSGGTNG